MPRFFLLMLSAVSLIVAKGVAYSHEFNDDRYAITYQEKWIDPTKIVFDDFRKHFPKGKDCYIVRAKIVENEMYVYFSGVDGGGGEDMQGANSKCGPSLVYIVTIDGTIKSREIVQ